MPTLFSVVVPAYAVQSYLDECLDSALSQHFPDVQVVAVDDASPDHTAAVLDGRAAQDGRITVVHLDTHVGPGAARNAGLERATGEYVWFVDGDDWLSPGSLAAVADQLRATGNPDVLMVGAAKERLNRKVVRDDDHSPGRTGPVTPGLAEAVSRPLPLIGMLVVRRQFLLESGIRFRTGWYEDVSFTFEVLLRARTAADFEPVCYVRRLDRPGAIRYARSGRHAEVVDQYEHLLSLPEVAADGKQRTRLLRRAATHMLTVYGDDRRAAGTDRRAFFRGIAALLERHGTGGSGGMSGLKERLAARDAFVAYEAMRRLRVLVGFGYRTLRSAHRLARTVGLALYYWLQRRLPLDENLVAYGAYWFRGYACNPAAIYEGAQRLAPHLRGVWIVNRPLPGQPVQVPDGVPYVVAGTRQYYRLMARAKWAVNNVGFPEGTVKRRGQVQVATHHGTPLKVMGYDQARYPASYNPLLFPLIKANCDMWDYSITSNRHTTLLWERQFPIRGETLEYGYPRNDVLVTSTEADVAAARESLGLAPGTRAVLYAPTHREWHATFTPVLDVDALAEALGPDTVILLRAHYFYGGTAMPPRHPRVLDVSGHPTVERLYLAADTLITDYSSVMFDYAVLDRPIAIFAPDWDIYRVVRGVTFDLAAEPPGVFTRTFDELVEAFRSGEVSGDQAAKARGQFRERFCSLEDGGATERVVRRVFCGDVPSPIMNG
jgi:CDP-glycerol glycerophosphotransferase